MTKPDVLEDFEAASLPLWREALVGVEWLSLRASGVFRCIGVPEGDGSGVVVIPGFLGSDRYLGDLHGWLGRLGYRSYLSGIGRNIECPNVLMGRLLETIDLAQAEAGGSVHLIGHSLGGTLARAAATLYPKRIASVITMASPFRGVRAHPLILQAAAFFRQRIHGRTGDSRVPVECYSGFCKCDAVDALRRPFPASVLQTAIYTKNDGVVDWNFCIDGDPETDIEVSGSHVGLVFNPRVYRHIAERLACAPQRRGRRRRPKLQTFG
ncbi:MAG: alpha/beta fold hydrolase [Dehalococcoidia bacterium]